MQQETGVTAIAHVIQLSVAPVFLLLGMGTLLAVLTSRLARIIDRARVLQRDVGGGGASPAALRESHTLVRRGQLISYAIALCTTTALLICAVVAVLFAGAFLNLDTSRLVAVLFIAAMAAIFLGLVLFLREVFLATAGLRLGLETEPPVHAAASTGDRGHPPVEWTDPNRCEVVIESRRYSVLTEKATGEFDVLVYPSSVAELPRAGSPAPGDITSETRRKVIAALEAYFRNRHVRYQFATNQPLEPDSLIG